MRALVTTVTMETMTVVVGGSSTGHHGKENENLHDELTNTGSCLTVDPREQPFIVHYTMIHTSLA
jgi:hypothetical protein